MTLRVELPDGAPIPRDYVGDLSAEGVAALLRPGRVGAMQVQSRVVMPAMETNLGTKDGFVTDRLIAYYEARARGGVAWVTTENTSVHSSGRVTPLMLRIETDEHGASFAPLADAIHAAGSKLLVQLSHAGRQTLHEFAGGPPWAPSAIACPIMKDEPRAMTEADIHELIAAFVAGASRAKSAGADGVELHMAHGYLLCGFLSPDQNHRDDAWGGDTERRCRFPMTVVSGIREACGPDFAIVCRISADEYVEGGIVADEAVRIARKLVAAGADALHVSACNYESMFWNIPTYFLPEAPFVPLARRIKEVVDVPVISVGRLHRPAVAARVLLDGAADFVALGRALIADPAIVANLRQNTPEGIRPCLACNRCIASINGALLECTVNPEVGFEGVEGKASSGRTVIVGGGVAGMAAAVAAAGSGESVTLIEREPQLGGQLDVAAMPPGKEPVAWYDAWLQRQVRDAGIDVILGREATAADLEGADRLVWAAGSLPAPLELPGELPHVSMDDAMRDPSLAGPKPVVIGAGAGGSEAAHWLAHRGAAVSLLEARRKIGFGLIPNLRHHLEAELAHEGVRCFVQVKKLALDGDAVTFTTRRDGDVRLDAVSAIVVAAGRNAIQLPDALAAFEGEVITLGDAREPGSIYEAIAGAARRSRG